MSVLVEPVRNRAQLDEFITLPRRLYDGMAGYVAPLDMERRELLDPDKSPFFRHGRAAYWIARREGRAAGRISAQIDELSGPATPPDLGLFGCLDAIDDRAVTAELLGTAEHWLQRRNRRQVRGPFQLSINGESGLLVEGQHEPPMTLLPWHPAYLDRHVRDAGYNPAMRLISYVLDLHNNPPEKLQDSASERGRGFTIRTMRLDQLETEMEAARAIYNDGWRQNWGFVPGAESDTRGLARSFKQFLLPDGGFFIDAGGEPAAFAVSIPNILDISADLGGAPGLAGWLKLLVRIKRRRYNSFRLVFIGAATKHHGSGIGKLALAETVRRLQAHGAKRIACAWVLETNTALIRILTSLRFRATSAYHLYGKQLLG